VEAEVDIVEDCDIFRRQEGVIWSIMLSSIDVKLAMFIVTENPLKRWTLFSTL
jgi:hypothetical protein